MNLNKMSFRHIKPFEIHYTYASIYFKYLGINIHKLCAVYILNTKFHLVHI